jgi:hypothetical protein
MKRTPRYDTVKLKNQWGIVLKARNFLLLFLCLVLLLLSVPLAAAAQDGEDVKIHFIDGENITRWSDTSVVYRNKATTEQNEWGYNILVNADGKVTKTIDVGDLEGKNLAVPKGGMVVSCNGTEIDWYKQNVSVGDYAYYDTISSRILFSKTGSFLRSSGEHAVTVLISRDIQTPLLFIIARAAAPEPTATATR